MDYIRIENPPGRDPTALHVLRLVSFFILLDYCFATIRLLWNRNVSVGVVFYSPHWSQKALIIAGNRKSIHGVHIISNLLEVANVQRFISTCWLICQMWLSKMNPADKPQSCDLEPFPLKTEHCCQESNQYSRCSPHLISFMSMLKWKTHLVLTTTGPIHSPIQLWVAGFSHSAPQSAAYILQKQRFISCYHNIFPSQAFNLYSCIFFFLQGPKSPIQTEMLDQK